MGDFNLRDINWRTWSTSHGSDSTEAIFLETISDSYLFQHVTDFTRVRGDDTPSTIDLIFSNEEMQVSNVIHHAPLGPSDHVTLTFEFHCYLDYSKPRSRYVYDKGDYDSMRSSLESSNWCEGFMKQSSSSVNELWSDLKQKLIELRNQYVPIKLISGKPNWKERSRVPLSKNIRNLMKDKDRAHRQWMSHKDHPDSESFRLHYTRLRNQVKTSVRRAKRNFEKNIADSAKINPKLFWSFSRSKLNTKPGVSPLLEDEKDSSSLKYSDTEKAEVLQKQFCSVFIQEPEGGIPQLEKRTKASINSTKIIEGVVMQKLQSLCISKSQGPDELHPRLLKELAQLIARPLTLLYQMSLDLGTVPDDWRIAYVSPIFKKGSRSKASNYRPVSLTSVLCKIMESFVREAMLHHLIENNLLTKKQYGFLTGRSTTLQLLHYLDRCAESVSKGCVVDAIYLDFAKAFDTVPHRRLIGKLQAYGIKGEMLKWVESFLSERVQEVLVNGSHSARAQVLSGIPQGSVLGPILFVLYINDLPDMLKSDCYLFADDTKILCDIRTREDALSLQKDLHIMEEWSNTWLLRFHPDKCHVLSLGRHENIVCAYHYNLFQQELEHVFDEKDLGVYFDSDLSFNEHIQEKIIKANVMVGIIRRTFSFLNCDTFRKLYIAFVRPHLEYAQAVWSPHFQKQIDAIENVQVRATKLVDGLAKMEYSERLKQLHIPSLSYRRARGDMIEVYKHFNNYDPVAISTTFQPQTRPSRQHNCILIQRSARDGVTGVQSSSFYYRTPRIWNKLPRHVAEAENINSFKNALDTHWDNIDLKYNYKAPPPYTVEELEEAL